MKDISGNTHKTIINGDLIHQTLNAKLRVPSKEQVNKLVDLLRKNNIEAASVIFQDKQTRISERLDGEFNKRFSHKQCLQAIKFLKKLHNVLKEAEPIGSFHMVRDFGDGETMVWGDVNAGNFLWRNNKVVGIVDYDCVMQGNVWVDIAMAVVNWQKTFRYKQSKEIIDAYGIEGDWIEYVQKYILITHKQYADVSFGLNHIKKSREYCEKRIINFNKQYEKSIIWRQF